MRVRPTRIAGVAVIEYETIADDRGGFARTFCERELADAGLPFRIVQANLSTNVARHTLRGMHFQSAPHGEPKIVACTRGRVFDVAVDLRPGSPTWRQWEAIELAPELDRAFHIAPGLAHGFLTLEPDSHVTYLMGVEYVPGAAQGVRFDDPALAIEWPAPPAVISDRDAGYVLLADGVRDR